MAWRAQFASLSEPFKNLGDRMYKQAILSLLSSSGILFAQGGITAKPTTPAIPALRTDVAGFGPIGITTALAGPIAPIAGAPYSAVAVTERVQNLADGNRIVEKTTGSVARDSKGRTQHDESLPDFILAKNGDAPHIVFIDDPVAGIHWNLDARTKTALKMVLPQMKQAAEAGNRQARLAQPVPDAPIMPPPPGAQNVFFYSAGVMPRANVQIIGKQHAEADAQLNRVDLGTQSVEGVPAQGTKITRTIPAGEVGNEQPLTITTETWFSPDLKVLVMSKTIDPRMGETTYRLTEVQRSEPSAELFQVPSDYSIKDGPKMQQFTITKDR
jgi:hypothetical protein